jgi:hypothetical protein
LCHWRKRLACALPASSHESYLPLICFNDFRPVFVVDFFFLNLGRFVLLVVAYPIDLVVLTFFNTALPNFFTGALLAALFNDFTAFLLTPFIGPLVPGMILSV